MSFNFNRAFDKVAKHLVIPQSDHDLFLEKVEFIKNKILQKMDEFDSVFKGLLLNMEETAVYMKGSTYVDFPINFNSYLHIKIPFGIMAVFYESSDDVTPIVKLCALTKEHSFLKNGKIKHTLFNCLIAEEFMKAITVMRTLTYKDGIDFDITYEMDLTCGTHVITASENADNKIIFTFMPSFMIMNDGANTLPNCIECSEDQKHWFAVPIHKYEGKNFYGINHKWQNVKRREKIKAKNLVNLLFKVLRRAHVVNPDLFMKLRTLVIGLINCSSQEHEYLSSPLGSLFMMELFVFVHIVDNPIFEKFQDLYGALHLEGQIDQIRMKFKEFQLGKKRCTVDNIKALFINLFRSDYFIISTTI